MKSKYNNQSEYITKDGSIIRELMHPSVHFQLGVQKQSLAEACVTPGTKTALHRHFQTEELYHIVAGRGLMQLGENEFEVEVGDTVCIPPGTEHCIRTLGNEPLRILCCCNPAYSHHDTELI